MRLTTFVLAVAAVLGLRQAREAPFPTGTATLTGTVVVDEPNGQPVKRAWVGVRLGDGSRTEYQATDDRGRFTVTRLPAGNVGLTVSKPAYVTTSYGARQPGSMVGLPIALTEGATTDVTVRLPRGAAIAGVVTDENGDPMPSVAVRVQRVGVSALGQRVFTTVQGPVIPSTDDRGGYRIYGLAAGDYVVTAQPRPIGTGEIRQTTAAELEWAARQLITAKAPSAGAGAQAETSSSPASRAVAYASVYYPGTVNAASAGVITLAAGQERAGVDLRMQFVQTARVEGTVTDEKGLPVRFQQVLLIPEAEGGSPEAERSAALAEAGLLAGMLGGLPPSTTGADGSFSVQGVEPGNYTILVRRGQATGRLGGAAPQGMSETFWAMTDVRVEGRDVTGIALRVAPAQTATGRFVFETGTTPQGAKATVSFRAVNARGATVAAPALPIAPGSETFLVTGLIPAPYRVVASVPGWTLKSAMVGTRDVADLPLEVKPGENISDLVITLTNTPTELTGILYDGASRPSSDVSIVLFAADRAMWFGGSRRVRPAVRPASDGRFTFTGLVAGEYYLAAVNDVTAQDLSNPQFLDQVVPAAIKVVIAHGEKKTQDLKIVR